MGGDRMRADLDGQDEGTNSTTREGTRKVALASLASLSLLGHERFKASRARFALTAATRDSWTTGRPSLVRRASTRSDIASLVASRRGHLP